MYTITKQLKNNEGFSLMETIMALGLSLTISLMVLMIVTPGLKNVRDIKSAERLHANSVRTADTLSYLVKEGEYIEVPNSSELSVRLPDGTIKTFTHSGQSVELDGNAITDPEVSVDSLNFQHMAESVRMEIALTHASTGRTASHSFTITKRNTL